MVRLADELAAFFPFGALEPIRADLALSYGRASLLLVLYPVVGLFGSVGGVASDHVSRRLLASLGALGYGAGFLTMAVGPGFGALVVGISVAGVSSTVMIDATEVALAELAADEDELRTLLGQQNVLGALGSIVGPLVLAATLALGLGWRPAFGVAAAVLFAYGAFLATQPLPPPRPVPEDAEAPSFWAGLGAVVRDGRVWTIGLVVLLLTPFDEPFLGFAIAFLDQTRGHSPAVATLLGGATTIGGVAGAAAAGRVGRRLGDRTSVTGAGVVALGVLAVAVAPGAVLQAAGAAAVGTGLYVVWIDVQARTLTLRPGQAGTTGSVVDAISETGAVLPLAIGHLADRAGLPAAMAAFVGLAALLVLAASRLARLRPPGPAGAPPPADPSPPGPTGADG
ncbi:MAG: MFS transporter [Acidimicrobiales bacterium]